MALSFKALALAAIGIGSILGAGPSLAAPAAPIANDIAASPLVKVDYYRRDYYRPPHRPVPAACTPGQAENKANRMGLYNTRVVVNRNVVRVNGWKRGYRTAVVFARAPGCPIIR